MGGTYLGWREGHLPWIGGYLPWMGKGVITLDEGEGVPTLDGGYLPWMGWNLPWMGGGTYPLQVMPRAVCLLHPCRRTFLFMVLFGIKTLLCFTDDCDEVHYYSGGYRCLVDGDIAGVPTSAESVTVTVSVICRFALIL